MGTFGKTDQHEHTSAEERVIEREVLVKQRIPLECNSCESPISQDEVDWIGPDTIKCPSVVIH